ncbi:hypothetical protein QYF36_004020 [Acer negundo]|nr:hypothetical protein QYF36_004020 [Acer negundo]
MQKAELVFIPSSGVGHLVSMVEIAKLLVERDHRLSITVLIINLPNFDSKITATYTGSLNRIKFIHLPTHTSDPKTFFTSIIESQKHRVKEAITQHVTSLPDTPRLAGFVLDIFCTSMIDVANDFGVPSYIYFVSGAAFLGFMFHAQFLHDELKKPISDLKDSDTELVVPTLANPIHAKFLPSAVLNTDWVVSLYELTRRFRTVNGIMVNTFTELESYAVNALSDSDIPPLYPVGPMLNLDGNINDTDKKAEIVEWLDDQPPSSVVFLCFGSMGCFDEDQLKEIACALEQCRHRFLWSLRKDKDKFVIPSDYENLTDVLPEGFLDRTVGVGKLVRELGLAVEIKMDYRKGLNTDDKAVIVTAEEIERGIKCLMEYDTDIRNRVKEMSVMSRKALMDGGSSFSSLGRFITDVMDNINP